MPKLTRSGYPSAIYVRYNDAFTDRESADFLDRKLKIDGRWSAETVRRKLIEQAEEVNHGRGYTGHPLTPAGYWGVGEYTVDTPLHPMPFVTAAQHVAFIDVPTNVPGVVARAFVIRQKAGGIEVFEGGHLCGWIVGVTDTTVSWRVDNGQPDVFVEDAGLGNRAWHPAFIASTFDRAVAHIVRRKRGWA